MFRVLILSLHTNPLELPGSGIAGGLNVYVWNVIKQLLLKGYQVDLVTVGDLTIIPTMALSGLKVHNFNFTKVIAAPKTLEVESIKLAQYLNDYFGPFTFDLIHAHYWLSSLVGIELKRKWNVPLVYTGHTWAKLKPTLNTASSNSQVISSELDHRIQIETLILHQFDLIIINSTSEKTLIQKYYPEISAKLQVITPGVATDIFKIADKNSVRLQLGLELGIKYLGFVGRLHPLKAPDFAIKIMSSLQQRIDFMQVKLLIIGGEVSSEDNYLKSLKDQVKELNLQKQVIFIPAVTQNEIAKYYQALDILLVPSYSETFGLVVKEAQACATPVITSNFGGLNTVVENEKNGIMIANHDVVAWSNKIVSILVSPVKYQRLALKVAKEVQQQNWEKMVQLLINDYETLINSLNRN